MGKSMKFDSFSKFWEINISGYNISALISSEIGESIKFILNLSIVIISILPDLFQFRCASNFTLIAISELTDFSFSKRDVRLPPWLKFVFLSKISGFLTVFSAYNLFRIPNERSKLLNIFLSLFDSRGC